MFCSFYRASRALEFLVSVSLVSSVLFTPSHAWSESAAVLPKGRSRMSLSLASTASVGQNFNSDGKPESVTAAYGMDLNAAQLTQIKPDVGNLVRILNDTGLRYNKNERQGVDHGLTLDSAYPLIGDALNAGTFGVDAKASRLQYNFAYQVGVTDRLTVGFFVPYIKAQVKVNSSISGVNTAGDISYAFTGVQANQPTGSTTNPSGNTSGNPSSSGLPIGDYLNQLAGINTETFQSVLAGKGYDRLQDSETHGLGDVVMGARFNYLNKTVKKAGYFLNSVQLGTTAPTGRLKSPTQLAGVDLGSGTWDVTGSHIANYAPWKFLTVSHSLNYTYQAPSKRELRIKKDAADILPDASSQERLYQNLGDKYWTNLGFKLQPFRWLSIDASYEWFWKRTDRYRGGRTDLNYSTLSANTESHLETVQLGLSISSVSAFLQKKFFIPADLGINVYLPRRGLNTPIVAYGTAELALYF